MEMSLGAGAFSGVVTGGGFSGAEDGGLGRMLGGSAGCRGGRKQSFGVVALMGWLG